MGPVSKRLPSLNWMLWSRFCCLQPAAPWWVRSAQGCTSHPRTPSRVSSGAKIPPR